MNMTGLIRILSFALPVLGRTEPGAIFLALFAPLCPPAGSLVPGPTYRLLAATPANQSLRRIGFFDISGGFRD
jgi:hypothetical protein